MRIKRIGGAAVMAAAVLFMACEGITEIIEASGISELPGIIADTPPSTPTEAPPFVITRPAVEIAGRVNHFKYAGIVFALLNHGGEPIDKITVSFMLFDNKTGAGPFIGSNKFQITKMDFVSPGENREITISLDRYIYCAPTEPYTIDFFYISEIHYVNGGVWRDEFGKYRVRP